MPSSYKPWEFFSQYPQFFSKEKTGLYALSCDDSYIGRMAHKKAMNHFGQKIQVVLGSELTSQWIEDNYISTGLFGSTEHFLILMAENIPSSVQDDFIQYEYDLNDRLLFFSFSAKSSFFDKLQKKKEGTFYKIESVSPWQYDRLLGFYANELRVNLSYEAKEFMHENLPQDSGVYISLLKNIKLSYPQGPSLKDLKELIVGGTLDQFEMADLYSEKKFKDFYLKLMNIDASQGDWIRFFSFLQGHLFKISDTSYLKTKKKPSKYDNKIVKASSHWNKDEIKRELKKLSELQILVKTKPLDLKTQLGLNYLRFAN